MTVAEEGNRDEGASRRAIREAAGLSGSFVLMNALAATIATHGLLQNSTAVVIGAMIVAMLLNPIMGLALAVVDGDGRLAGRSFFALTVGAATVVAVATSFAFLYFGEIAPTAEILSRTAPNELDLMIALAGGAAGAYATVTPKISEAVVGVAIATALVPPLCAGSILMVHGHRQLASDAFLLAFTNMVAIQFAASVVLWLTGLRRERRHGSAYAALFKRGLPTLVLMALLTTILTLNLRGVIAKQRFEGGVTASLRRALDGAPGSYLAEVRFERAPGKTIVRAVLRAPQPPSPQAVGAMEDGLPRPSDGTAVELRVRYLQTLILTREGELVTDSDMKEWR
jgi:uncharacterized hydrophobic protein (TIGR00271 family)